MLVAAGCVHIRWVTWWDPSARARSSDPRPWPWRAGSAPGLGVAADFFPVRRLLIILAVLSLPTAGWGWLFDDPAGGVLLLSLVQGGLVSLPWVLMGRSCPVIISRNWPWPSPGWACWAARWGRFTGSGPLTSGAWTRPSGSSSLRPVRWRRWLPVGPNLWGPCLD